MFGMNMRVAFLFLKPVSNLQSPDLAGKKQRIANDAISIVMWSRLLCFHGIFVLTRIGPFELGNKPWKQRFSEESKELGTAPFSK
jgi:hypothetical protein